MNSIHSTGGAFRARGKFNELSLSLRLAARRDGRWPFEANGVYCIGVFRSIIRVCVCLCIRG